MKHVWLGCDIVEVSFSLNISRVHEKNYLTLETK